MIPYMGRYTNRFFRGKPMKKFKIKADPLKDKVPMRIEECNATVYVHKDATPEEREKKKKEYIELRQHNRDELKHNDSMAKLRKHG